MTKSPGVEARRVFERILSLNPNDNQGVRICLADLTAGRTWEEGRDEEDREEREQALAVEARREGQGRSHQFQMIWRDQSAASLRLRERFGLETALNYLVGEKLFNFVEAAETRPEFASELPRFVAWIRRHFEPAELDAVLKPTRKRGPRAYFGTGVGAVVRDRKRLERIRFMLVDAALIN